MQEYSSGRKSDSGAKVTSDNPIRRLEEDTIGRAVAAKSFARQVLELDAKEGVVVGVLGAWGSGKTSFINLARTELEREGVPILDFNPWMFSGAEQLVESFFTELAAQLKIRPGFEAIGKDIEEYGEAFSGLVWLPVLGPWIERGRSLSKIVSQFLQRRKEGIGDRREKLEEALCKIDHPIVIVLDDIDRLSSFEIREVFKLVRLTASFPNIVYVVAFDRARVEKALSDEGVPGRDYLEKILQLAVDIPAIQTQVMDRQIFGALDNALSGITNTGPFDDQIWPDLFTEIVRPLVRNMRDVRRYAVAVRGTVNALDGQIVLADVLTLEAIRIFLPDVYGNLHTAVEALTTASGMSYGSLPDPPHLKASVDSLMQASTTHQKLVQSMIKHLFPAAQQHVGGSHFGAEWAKDWLLNRRVAHGDLLRLYLERVAGGGLQAFTDAERAFGVMADRTAFDTHLHSLDVNRLEDVIKSLETFEAKFLPEHVVPGTTVLLNLLQALPDRPRGMFDFDPRVVVSRVIYRLLRSLKDANLAEQAVKAVLPELTSLSVKLELITIVGYREGVGHKLVSESVATELEKAWRSDVLTAISSALVNEYDLFRVFLVAKLYGSANEPPLEVPDVPEVTLATLRTSRSEARIQSEGKRAIRRSSRLAWDTLIELFGGLDEFNSRIDRLKESKPQGEDELLKLVDKYLTGWRPGNFLEN
ncbi:MAG: P-loop NTPase fold protein [Nitrospirales bacterium]